MLVSLLLIIHAGHGLAFISVWRWFKVNCILSWKAIKFTAYHAYIHLL
jgi:hypothetical protein